MRISLVVAWSVGLVACDGGSSSTVGTVGWNLNFKDWTCLGIDTSTACQEQLRGCDNQPSPTIDPPYNAISTVHVVVADPDGQVEGIDDEFECSRGSGGERVSLLGIVRKVYALTIEAKSSSGTVFYSLQEPALDLTATVDKTYELPVRVGEIDLYLTFAGAITGDCPADVSTITWQLFPVVNGTAASTPAVSGSKSCVDTDPARLVVREIPVDPKPGFNNNYIQTSYVSLFEGKDSANQTTWCKRAASRIVRPGSNENSLAGNEAMLHQAACP